MTRLKKILPHLLIASGIAIALSPVLLGLYIRQDDMKWQLWQGMSVFEHYDYYHAVFRLVWPLSLLFSFFTDMVSYHMHRAVYIRLLSVVVIAGIGILVYRWQKHLGTNKWMAVSFSIAALSLPPFQVFAATVTYLLMSATVFTATLSVLCLWKSFLEKSASRKILFYVAGCFFFFTGLLTYPLCAMWVCLLLLIALLNADEEHFGRTVKRVAIGTFTFIVLMLLFLVVVKWVHEYFHVDTSAERPVVTDLTRVGDKINRLLLVLSWHAHLWMWKSHHAPPNAAVISIGVFFLLGLLFDTLNMLAAPGRRKSVSGVLMAPVKLGGAAFFLALSYSPALASVDFNVNFRYAVCTMPVYLYLLYWSTDRMVSFLEIRGIPKARTAGNVIFLSAALFGIFSSHRNLEQNIVGPHQHELLFIRDQLEEKALPLLQKGEKIAVQVVWYSDGPRYYEYEAVDFEYGMRIHQYHDACLGAVVHALRNLGMDYFMKGSGPIYREKKEVGAPVPWGLLVATHESLFDQHNSTLPYPRVVIDLREAGPYPDFDLYRKFFTRRRLP